MKFRYIAIAALVWASAGALAAPLKVNSESVRRMALDSDLRAAISDNDLESALLQQKVARTAYLPNLAGSATGAWMLPDSEVDGTTKLIMHGVYMAGLNITQPVFAGGKIVASNKLARIGRESAEIKRRQTRVQIVAEADKAYWTLVATRAKVSMAEAYLRQIDTAYQQTLVALEAGMVTENDLLRIDARRSQVTYQLQQAASGADLCRMALCRTIGLPLDTQLECEEMLPLECDMSVDSLGAPGSAPEFLDQRPEVQLLQKQIEAKEQEVKVVRADFLPSLGLQIGWSAFGNAKMKGFADGPDGQKYPFTQEFKNNSFMGMLSLQVPVFHWGEGFKKVKRARVEALTARLQLDHNRQMMQLEIEQAQTAVSTSAQLITTAATALRQAEKSLGNMQQRYDVGMSNLTDLLDAQAQWAASYSNLIEARAQHHLDITEYLRVTAQLPYE